MKKIIKVKSHVSSVKTHESETAIDKCLDILQSEYIIERNKKISFESRAGIILALIGTFCVFLLENVEISEIFALIEMPLTFQSLVKIVSGILMYLCLLVSLGASLYILVAKKILNFEVNSMNDEFMLLQRETAMKELINAYRGIISHHRMVNNKVAIAFIVSIIGSAGMILSLIGYKSI